MSDTEKPSEDSEPKLVVDTDWKEQVAKEKEAAAAQADATAEQADAAAQPADNESDSAPAESEADEVLKGSEDPSEGEPGDMPAPPPATFQMLLSMMFSQAMVMLGQMPDPATGEVMVNKPYAKHYIDTLEMLGEKTTGNLSDDEEKMLSEALHALRMMYVNAKAT